jgi:MFS transporter, FSR family, fosmidomycin resistance protein
LDISLEVSDTRDVIPSGIDRRGIGVLSAGHACVDMCQGAVPAMLPFLVAQRGYSYGAASALVLAATVASSIVQPLFGLASDRHAAPWLMPAGLLLAGAGLAVAGLVHPYAATFAAITVSGLGVAAYHPEASRYANYVSGGRHATGMSLFSVGGNAGFALGPLLVTPLLLLAGPPGTAGLLLPLAVAALLFTRELSRLHGFRPVSAAGTHGEQGPDRWGPFARLGLAVSLRSIVYFGLLTFVPLYYVNALHTSKATGNLALTAMLVAGAVGTLIGGRVADRIGTRPIFVGSLATLTPLIAVFLLVGPGPGIAVLAAIGGLTIATFSVTVVMGQALLPNRVGVASGVTLGLSIGVGGIAASALGVVADHWGLHTALDIVMLAPLPALALALTLPRVGGRRMRRGRGRMGTPGLMTRTAPEEP